MLRQVRFPQSGQSCLLNKVKRRTKKKANSVPNLTLAEQVAVKTGAAMLTETALIRVLKAVDATGYDIAPDDSGGQQVRFTLKDGRRICVPFAETLPATLQPETVKGIILQVRIGAGWTE